VTEETAIDAQLAGIELTDLWGMAARLAAAGKRISPCRLQQWTPSSFGSA
jgi:hypothetical protein